MNKTNPIIYQDKDKTVFNIFSKYGTFEVTIDTEDVEKIKVYKWHVSSHWGRVHGVGACPKWLGTTVYLHNFVTGNSFSDHIDGDVLNNRKVNLRECSKKQNNRNVKMHRDNKSGYKGVTFWKGKFIARIVINYEHIYLGSFNTAIEAAQAYNEVALKYFGEFAKLNKIA